MIFICICGSQAFAEIFFTGSEELSPLSITLFLSHVIRAGFQPSIDQIGTPEFAAPAINFQIRNLMLQAQAQCGPLVLNLGRNRGWSLRGLRNSSIHQTQKWVLVKSMTKEIFSVKGTDTSATLVMHTVMFSFAENIDQQQTYHLIHNRGVIASGREKSDPPQTTRTGYSIVRTNHYAISTCKASSRP
jgi:hypothetical protein